jgi:quinoprotein glucose dehydrogenase
MAMGAIRDQAALKAAAGDASPSVRLAALLAFRKLATRDAHVSGREKRAHAPEPKDEIFFHAELVKLLADPEPALVLEAARAINDEGIAPAFGALAKLIAKPVKHETLMLRVLNANFREGTAATAQALATYAADDAQPAPLRGEALHLLSTWAKPFPRDRVTGLYRPLPDRDSAPAVAALAGALPNLLASKSEPVATGALDAAAALDAKESGPAVFALFSRKEAPPKLRAAALRTLGTLDDPRLPEAITIGAADESPALRVQALGYLGKLKPDDAAAQLAKTFPDAALPEKKTIIALLGDNPSAEADNALGGFLDELKAGKIPAEAKLELLEAAEKRQAAELKTRLAAYQQTLPPGDAAAKYGYALAGGDRVNGEKLFKEHAVAQCARCHKVGGVGGEAGPDLTGIAAKKDRRYLLEAVVEPNAHIAEGFQTVMVTLKNNDIKAGVVKAETADTVTLQMPVPAAPVEEIKKSEIKLRENAPSGMPPMMGEMLNKRELRDIVEYLATLKG